MIYASGTHSYKELIIVTKKFIKTGEGKILGGLITWPKGYYEEKKTYTGVCNQCLEKEITPNHGYFKIDQI